MAQKAIGGTGYIAAGLYHGLGSENLFTNSEGDVVRTGFMAAIFAPDIKVGVTGLYKINFAADIQTGKNVLGAGGVGVNFYFDGQDRSPDRARVVLRQGSPARRPRISSGRSNWMSTCPWAGSEDRSMKDLAYVGLTLIFFIASWLYVKGLERL